MNWTKEQSHAINMPVSDIIVSAAAGSGKTAVMAERILKSSRYIKKQFSFLGKFLLYDDLGFCASFSLLSIFDFYYDGVCNGYSNALYL